MAEYNGSLIDKYRNRGILVDTNLLLLRIIGSYDQTRITKFKRTMQFAEADFELLQETLQPFALTCTTQAIVTEVSNFVGQLSEPARTDCMNSFAYQLVHLHDETRPNQILAEMPEFVLFGLTDASILAAAKDRYLVLTDDARLAAYANARQIDTINFNYLRSI